MGWQHQPGANKSMPELCFGQLFISGKGAGMGMEQFYPGKKAGGRRKGGGGREGEGEPGVVCCCLPAAGTLK